MREEDWTRLRSAAFNAREHAYAPYSNFAVGAALLTDDGRIFSGCNVENASYGATLCAERNAIGAGVAAGARRWVALAIASDAKRPTPPCGICRQALIELGRDLEIRCFTKGGDTVKHTLASLLPDAFDAEQLS
ncbi:MAG: cytidine deaminase [Polyangiales bacterium]